MNMLQMVRCRSVFLWLFLLCTISFPTLSAQDISVKSFRLLETDLTANTEGTMKRDQNNEVSALIKVVTTETGFAFDGGMLGIVGTEQRTGEIWVYVPQKSRKITLSHQQLGVLRDYYYPVPVEAGRTYEMVLATGKVTTIVQESAGGQYLVMTVSPANAEVYIDDVPVEVADGVVATLLKYGKHTYRVSAALYEPTMGQIEIGNAKKELSVALQPAYGILELDSDPAGAEVYIDGDYQPAGTTPFTSRWLSPGKHTLKFKMSAYKTRTMEVVVPGNGATQSVEAVLQPNFAEVSVSAPGESEIYINNEMKGVGRWSGRLNAGFYTVEARKASHYSSLQSVEVAAGDRRIVTLPAPTPRYGSLNVNTRPIGATVSVDGSVLTGTTPNIYADILIGEHVLTVAKPGYVEAEQRITVEEGKVLPVSFTLIEGEKAAAVDYDNKNNDVSEARIFPVSGAITRFFPVYGFVLGSVSSVDLRSKGYDVRMFNEKSKCCDVNGLTFWDHDGDDFFEHIYMTHSDVMPEDWIKLGLNWRLSYNQILKLFKGMGFSIKIKNAPVQKRYSGRRTLSADVTATSNDGCISFDFDFDYGNRNKEGYSKDSPNSLYSITIRIHKTNNVGAVPSARLADSQSVSGQEEKKEAVPFVVVEKKPVFPGGQKALQQYIASHVEYPVIARENGLQGRVIVRFVVGEDGYVEDVQVIRGVHPTLDEEAVRVVRSLPRWTPGYQGDNPARVVYTMPIDFALQ